MLYNLFWCTGRPESHYYTVPTWCEKGRNEEEKRMSLKLFPTLNNSDSAVVYRRGNGRKRWYTGEKKAKQLANPKFWVELTKGGKQTGIHVFIDF